MSVDIDDDFDAAMGHLSTIQSYVTISCALLFACFFPVIIVLVSFGVSRYYASLDSKSTRKGGVRKSTAATDTTSKSGPQKFDKADDVVDYYSKEKGTLSVEARLKLAETCLARVHTLNKSLAQQLAVFKVAPRNSVERLLLDPSDSSLLAPVHSVTDSRTGQRRAQSAGDPNSNRRRVSTQTKVGRRPGSRDHSNSKVHDQCQREKERLLRIFNLKLHHAEQEASDSRARSSVLQQQLDQLNHNYALLESRLQELER